VLPTPATITATATLTNPNATPRSLKEGPQLITPRAEKPYPENSDEKLPFQWSAISDSSNNEMYHIEIRRKEGGQILHSKYVNVAEERVTVIIMQGENWLLWRVRTGILHDRDFTPTSQWSNDQEFKVTVQETGEPQSAQPEQPQPTPAK